MKKLIMPCMDIRHGKVVKGIKFEGVKDVADPVELAKYYDATFFRMAGPRNQLRKPGIF